jgi:hypothetical protein
MVLTLLTGLPLCLGWKLLLPPVLESDLGGSLGCWRLPVGLVGGGFGLGAGVPSGGDAGAGVVEIGGFLEIERSAVVGVGVDVGKGSIDLGWFILGSGIGVGAIWRLAIGVRVGVGLG